MESKVVCELCGGADFYQEAGFYYCNECLTQTQEIQEHTLEVPMPEQGAVIIEPPKRRSSKSSRSQEKRQQITSWECYNHIILGLVEELIQLGAKVELKHIVLKLWFTYLKELEVLHSDPLEPPRLPPFNNAGDAEAIYGRIPRRKSKIKKRRRSDSSGTTDYSNISATSKNLIKGKKRRTMALSEYEDRMSFAQSANISLVNQSLQSLKSDSEKSVHIKPIMFNTSAEEVLLNIMTKEHLEAHKEDNESEMNCHFTRRKMPSSYCTGPMILTRNKIYAILYLGLLFVKDDIQLADLLRFIREGQISYQYIDHFFPEDLENCELKLNKKGYCSMNPIFHYTTRETAYKLSKLLRVAEKLPIQNIVKIAERYVAELNLPREITNYVLKLISRTEPTFKIPKYSPKIPNYEARVAGFIVFVLKLLFGLDDATEFEMSSSASTLNKKRGANIYFDYIRWRDFIEYRKIIIGQYHFPTNHLINSSYSDSELYCNFLSELMQRQQIDGSLHKDILDVDHLLKKLVKTSNFKESATFLPTLTPFKSYLSVIENLNDFKNSNFDKKLLFEDFREDSIDFLVHPSMHYPGQVILEHKGANENIQMIKMIYRKQIKDNDFYQVNLSNDETLDLAKKFAHSKINFEHLDIDLNDELNKKMHKRNKKILKHCPKSTAKLTANESEDIFLHYLPEERLWINSTNMQTWDCHEDFLKFFEKFPYNFQLLIRETARITEQTIEDFMTEYINVELYMKHYYDFKTEEQISYEKNTEKNVNDALKNLIARIHMSW